MAIETATALPLTMANKTTPMAINNDDESIIKWFENIAEAAVATQADTLRNILQHNWHTEYVQNWLGKNDISGLDDEALEVLYTSSVPLASHADHEPYIRRIVDGDTAPILAQQPITLLSLSSGTTDGRPKYVPFTQFSSQSTLMICRLAAAYRSRDFPTKSGGRILEFIYSSKQYKTKGGITVGTATTHYFASEEFKAKQKSTKCYTCSPYEVISGGDYKQSTYCHLLLGLLYAEDVEFVASTFSYTIVQAFAAFEDLWEELCMDIKQGTLSQRITCAQMRRAVLPHLAPNPTLASMIESKCMQLKGDNWRCLVPKLWPNAKYVYSIMTGSMQPYLQKLRHYAGEVALVCADYGSTESWIGVNLEPMNSPEKVVFTLVPTFAYFEFIPLYRQENNGALLGSCDDFVEGQPVPMSKVKVGQQYEIVLTTFTGLYRYKLGDVVEIAGFYKGTPQLSFVCRRKLVLTLNIDKNTEKDLQLVVDKGSKLLMSQQAKCELIDFTSHADTTNQPGHYVIYWEIKGEVDDSILQQCSTEMDAAFMDHGYIVSRKTNSIGPLELRIVGCGCFHKILEYYIGNGATVNQFKTPRCVTNHKQLLHILDCCTVKSFWSLAYGH